MFSASLISSIPATPFFVILAFPLAMAGICIFASVQAFKRAKLIAAMPTSQIRTAQDGYVELEGRAEAIQGETLRAPLTGQAVCWYHAKVEEWTKSQSSKNQSSSWKVIKENTSTEPFLMRDGTGLCRVHPFKADVTPTDRSIWYGSTAEPQDRNPQKFGPEEREEENFTWSGTPDRKFRYTEERIYNGDTLFAIGQFLSGISRNNADNDEDDYFGEDDWCDEKRYKSMIKKAKESAFKSLFAPPSRKNPFVLSTTPQDKLLQANRAGWKATLIIALVPLGLDALLLWLRYR